MLSLRDSRNEVTMRDHAGKLLIPIAALAMAGAITFLAIYICYDYVASNEVSLKWYDTTEPGTAIEVTVSNLLLIGASSGIVIGGIGRLLGIRLANRVGVAAVLGVVGAVVVALCFWYLIDASALYHGPAAPGG